MIEPDEDLRRILRQWAAPEPGAALDARIRGDCREGPKRWKWLPIAAGFVLAVGIAAFWPSAKRTRVEEFQPLLNGAIQIVRTGEYK